MHLSVLAPKHIFLSLTEESHRVSRKQIDSPVTALPKVHCLVCHLEEEVHTCIAESLLVVAPEAQYVDPLHNDCCLETRGSKF